MNDSYNPILPDCIDKNNLGFKYLWFACLLIGGCTILRMLYGQAFLLTPDETNYWQWSRHLDWGYYDQTPMIAWAIRLSTLLFGHNELSVRLPSILSMAVASVYLVGMAWKWFGARVAWQTALISQTIFFFNVGGILATADGLQGASWAAVSYHSACALEKNQWRPWILSGLWLGIGLLSKYSMVLLPACVFGFVLFSPSHRYVLKRWQPYVASAIAIVIFSPVIFWNAGHHWNSFRHVAYIGGASQPFSLHRNYFFEFLGSQVGLLSPLVFGLIVASWIRTSRRGCPRSSWICKFICFTSFPVFALFSLLSLHTRVYANWSGMAYITAVVSGTAFWSIKGQGRTGPYRLRMIWHWTLYTSAAFSLIILIQVIRPIFPLPVHFDRAAHETIGWDLLGEKVTSVFSKMPHQQRTFVFGLSYQDASELAFYTEGQPFTVSINRWNRPNVYDDWWQDEELIGMDGVGVLHDGGSVKRLSEVFERVDSPIALSIHRPAPLVNRPGWVSKVRTFYIYPCYGFKGGLRWRPRDRQDIRVIGIH